MRISSVSSVGRALSFALLATLAMAPACASAQRPAVVRGSAVSEQGLTINVVPAPAQEGVPADATALYVVIQNRGQAEIAINHADFFIGRPGRSYLAAVAPQQFVGAPAAVPSVDGFRGKVVRARRFGASSYLPPTPRRLSEGELAGASLPSGTLRPGATLSGYLFFPAGGEVAELRWQSGGVMLAVPLRSADHQ